MVIKSLFFLKISLKNRTFQRKKWCRVCSVPPWWEMNLAEFKCFVPRPPALSHIYHTNHFFFNNCCACMLNTEYYHWDDLHDILLWSKWYIRYRSIYYIKMVYSVQSQSGESCVLFDSPFWSRTIGYNPHYIYSSRNHMFNNS